jgi:hypothetical protein
MQKRNLLFSCLAYPVMLLTMALCMNEGAHQFFPEFSQMPINLRAAAICFLVAIPYYFSALVAFFASPLTLSFQENDNGVLIAGRRFLLDSNFFNPANHIFLATIGVFVAILIAFFR